MAVIWGLDMKEMQWGKFKNSYMWNKEYHLRRTKFIVYQIAMIFCVVSESLGTAALSGMHSPGGDTVLEQKSEYSWPVYCPPSGNTLYSAFGSSAVHLGTDC
jgi:hypothetical protein